MKGGSILCWRTVVGVAADVKYARIDESPRPYIYLPLVRDLSLRTLHVRAIGDPATLAPRLEREIKDLAPDLPIADSSKSRLSDLLISKGLVTQEQIATLRQWIDQNAVWPEAAGTKKPRTWRGFRCAAEAAVALKQGAGRLISDRSRRTRSCSTVRCARSTTGTSKATAEPGRQFRGRVS